MRANDPLLQKMDLGKFAEMAHFSEDVQECLSNSVAVILATEWSDYLDMEPAGLTQLMHRKILIDGRRAFARHDMPEHIIYRTVGASRT